MSTRTTNRNQWTRRERSLLAAIVLLLLVLTGVSVLAASHNAAIAVLKQSNESQAETIGDLATQPRASIEMTMANERLRVTGNLMFVNRSGKPALLCVKAAHDMTDTTTCTRLAVEQDFALDAVDGGHHVSWEADGRYADGDQLVMFGANVIGNGTLIYQGDGPRYNDLMSIGFIDAGRVVHVRELRIMPDGTKLALIETYGDDVQRGWAFTENLSIWDN